MTERPATVAVQAHHLKYLVAGKPIPKSKDEAGEEVDWMKYYAKRVFRAEAISKADADFEKSQA